MQEPLIIKSSVIVKKIEQFKYNTSQQLKKESIIEIIKSLEESFQKMENNAKLHKTLLIISTKYSSFFIENNISTEKMNHSFNKVINKLDYFSSMLKNKEIPRQEVIRDIRREINSWNKSIFGLHSNLKEKIKEKILNIKSKWATILKLANRSNKHQLKNRIENIEKEILMKISLIIQNLEKIDINNLGLLNEVLKETENLITFDQENLKALKLQDIPNKKIKALIEKEVVILKPKELLEMYLTLKKTQMTETLVVSINE